MSNTVLSIRKRVSFFLILTILAPIATLLIPLQRVVAAVQSKVYRLVPANGRPGTYEVFISSDDPTKCKANKELAKASLIAPQGSSIQVRETTRRDDCSITSIIHIPADAPIGKAPLWIVDENNKILGITDFSVTDLVSPGQIPPGVNPPAVDVMWSVMPKTVVSHNFGKSLAENYYAIEIVIGNNSAYNLQLASVGFELPSDSELEGLVARNVRNRKVTTGGQPSGKASPGDDRARKTLSPVDQTISKRSKDVNELDHNPSFLT